MPFEAGQISNPSGRNGKQFKAALNVAIRRVEGDKTKLAQIAEALVDKAAAGDVQAIKEVADRLDGKATQLIAGDEDAAPILHRLVREIVDPKNASDRDGESIPATS